MSFHTLDIDVALDLMSGLVALLVSYYAFRYNKLLENSTLKFISVGFVMLGSGLLIEASTFSLIVFGIGDLTTDRIFALTTAGLYEILQLGAFFVFAFGYLRSAFATRRTTTTTTAAATSIAIFAFPAITSTGSARLREMFLFVRQIWAISEIFSVIFVLIVVLVGLLGYSETRHRFSLFIMLSFFLIFCAQVFDLWTALSISIRLDVVGSMIQFAGFLTLLIFLVWRGGIGPAREATQ
jgi:hypothetical protein